MNDLVKWWYELIMKDIFASTWLLSTKDLKRNLLVIFSLLLIACLVYKGHK